MSAACKMMVFWMCQWPICSALYKSLMCCNLLQVSVAVGGTFTLLQDSYRRPCLFVAGGIGITALSSMLASIVEQQQQQQQQSGAQTSTQLPRPFLLYSGQCVVQPQSPTAAAVLACATPACCPACVLNSRPLLADCKLRTLVQCTVDRPGKNALSIGALSRPSHRRIKIE
jgi:hypothetical protein